jgi:hypothetical protein
MLDRLTEPKAEPEAPAASTAKLTAEHFSVGDKLTER